MITSNILFAILVVIIKGSHVESSQPVLQRTVQAIFTERSVEVYPEICRWMRSSPRQSKMCKNDPGLADVLSVTRSQSIAACEETFRETALIYALIAASFSHAVAKACSAGNLLRCSCFGSAKGSSWQWKRSGCGDDFKYGKRATRNFLDFKHAGNDQIAEVLKQDLQVGMESIGEQLREVCKCHGFSGSCTVKTCWKRLAPFSSVMGLLKKHYHHAVKKKLFNYTTKRAIGPKGRKELKVTRKNLVYLHKTPNLCVSTVRRVCKDRDNCATLCCGRGYNTTKVIMETRCSCRMVNCCYVKCDTCLEKVDHHVCT